MASRSRFNLHPDAAFRPVVAHLMAELIDQVEKGHDHDSDPAKVKARYNDFVLDAGFYSRNREINPNSSFSVNG